MVLVFLLRFAPDQKGESMAGETLACNEQDTDSVILHLVYLCACLDSCAVHFEYRHAGISKIKVPGRPGLKGV
jgi:hypothetical protein